MKLLSLLFLAAGAAVAGASEEAAGHGGIPWGEILKQAVNFAILASALVYFLRKPVASFLKERSEMLRKSIEDAAAARADAAGKLADVTARMATLAGEIEAMNRRMDVEADDESKRFREAAVAEIERIREQARFAADQEVKKARAELRREAAELATRAAEEMVRTSITPDDQERMVRENIDQMKEIVR